MDIIRQIISSTHRYNLHSHTQFCDGRATMEQMTVAAIDAGFVHWGFSPHSPINIESSCNMSADDVPAYLAEVKRLRQHYGDHIRLYASMEIDYMSPDWGPASQIFQDYDLDYRIGSVHFVPTRSGEWIDCDGNFERFNRNMGTKFGGDIRYVVETFFTQNLKMIDAGGFDIIGHMDKIAHNASQYQPGIENEPWYTALADQLVDSVASHDIVAEVNTKALIDHGRMFPSARLIERLLERNVPLAINSDAHYPEKVNLGRPQAIELITRLQQQ